MNKITKVISALHFFLERGNGILKPQQKEIVQAIIQAFMAGHRAVYIEAPTGLGKTVITSQLLRALNDSGNLPRILVVTPSIKLLEDAGKKFKEFAPELHTGLYYTYAKDDAPITISTYASFPKLAETHASKYDLIILDEAHHILSVNLLARLQKFKKALWLAMTATPGFSPQKHLNQHFYLAHKTTIHEAIDTELISGYRNVLVYARAVNLDKVPLASTGDFSAPALERMVNINVRNMAAIDFYRHAIDPSTGQPLMGRKAIFNCVGIDHARDVADLMCKAIPKSAIDGRMPCAAIHGDMYRKDIKRILAAHKAGEIVCITQAKMMGEGHDDPEIKLVINLKPSLSMIEVPQRGGRALRINPGNPDIPALIVDFIDEGTLSRKIPLLFSEITGSPAYGKWLSTRIRRIKRHDVFSDDMEADRDKTDPSRYFRISGIDVVWSLEQIVEIVKERDAARREDGKYPAASAYPLKDGDWLSIDEIASHYDIPAPLVLKIIKRCPIERARPGIRIDRKKNIEWRMERRSLGNIDAECLHASHLVTFGKTYRLDTPHKTDDWLTSGEIADRLMQDCLRKVDGSAISSVFTRLKKTEGLIETRRDPQTMKEWRVGKKRHKMKVIICLHQDDFDAFCKEYHFDVLECSEDFLSPSEVAAQTGRTYASGIEKYLKACLNQNNMMGRQLAYAVEYRYVSGRPLPCLRRSVFPAFVAFQKAEAERRNAERHAYAMKYREERRMKKLKS
jgi:superfamily II DNA or RNA helicase